MVSVIARIELGKLSGIAALCTATMYRALFGLAVRAEGHHFEFPLPF